MKYFEQMAPYKAYRTRILLAKIKILVGSVPNDWTGALKDERILKISLCGHHTANACLLDAPLHVTDATNVAVRKHWHVHTLAHLLDDLPVRNARQWPFHLTSPAVNCQQLCASTFEHLSVLDCLFIVIKASYLACDWHAEVLMQSAH